MSCCAMQGVMNTIQTGCMHMLKCISNAVYRMSKDAAVEAQQYAEWLHATAVM